MSVLSDMVIPIEVLPHGVAPIRSGNGLGSFNLYTKNSVVLRKKGKTEVDLGLKLFLPKTVVGLLKMTKAMMYAGGTVFLYERIFDATDRDELSIVFAAQDEYFLAAGSVIAQLVIVPVWSGLFSVELVSEDNR